MENNPIPLKTSNPDFNRHDFVQTDCGLMEELTVEITLAEYRELVTQLATEKQEAVRFMFERDRARQDLCKAEEELTCTNSMIDKAVSDRDELSRENTRLRGEIERQRKFIDDLKTRLSNEFRHQTFVKEDAT